MSTLTGKTIARVTERQMCARDTFQEWRGFTETTLHFTDGTTRSFRLDNTEIYVPIREQLDCANCDHPLVESADYPDTYVHPFDWMSDEDHDPTPKPKPEPEPEPEPEPAPKPEPRASLPRDEDGFVNTSAEFGETFAVEVTYTTEHDGSVPSTDSPTPRTVHGPFVSEEEALAWIEDYPDADDVDDFLVLPLNSVRPEPEPDDDVCCSAALGLAGTVCDEHDRHG